MTKTVILLNPYGTDVTDFVNGTPGVPQLLNGTIMSPGDTLYTLPYDWTVSGISNINAGVTLLDAKLHATSGDILVFGYSEGCQIADKWLTTDGPTSSISPTVLSFLLIGNADRKYGGFCYGQAAFDPVAWTGGKPADTAYTVTDFTRQYDPIGDFPNATAIVDALDALEAVTAGPNVLNEAMQSVADVVASTVDSTAALNALAGLLLIHIDYLSVALSDAGNVSLVEGNITWVWSPTYPIPLLGISTLSPRSDLQTRPVIEDAFDRPVSLPLPDYGALILALAPAWATQVPSAPVQQTPGKAFQITQPSSQQVQSMQSQLLQSVWQAFVQIVDGFLDLGTEPSDQLAQWNTDFQTAITNAQTAITTIISSFAPGGTAAEFLTGVTNLLALVGLTPSDIGGATVIDTVWTDVINDIINPLNAIEAQANKVIVGVGNDLTDFFDWITGTPTPTSSTQVQAAAVTSTLGGGSTSLGTDVSFVQSAATGLASTVAQVQSNVNSLQNSTDATVGGVQIIDDGPGTNATGAGWGSDWTLNSGSNANLNLGFQCLGGTAIGSYTGESLNTDNMVAGIIFISLPQFDWLGDSADGARHRVKIRESSDRSSCVFADIWHDKVQLGYRKASVDTYWGSAVSITPAAGSNWELYGGDAAGATPYLFQLVQNGVTMSPIATFTDSSHVSNMGSSYRGSGQDMYSDGSYNPGKTKFHARDLIQPLLKTMMAQHRNTSGTASSLAAGAIYKLPVGWFNNQVYLMPGVTMDATNAGYIVADEGLYEFSFGIELTTGVTGTPYIIAPVIWVNSAPYVEGNSVYAHDSAVSGYSAQITMSVYLFAGDTIYPALDARANQWTVAGESTGTLSWMQLAKVG